MILEKRNSNNLYFTSGKIGIGKTNPGANHALDVLNNINCNEIYRNGTPITSTISLFLPLTGWSDARICSLSRASLGLEPVADG